MAQPMSVPGIAIAKLVFRVVGMDDTGRVVLRKRRARRAWRPFIAQLSPLRIGMEACGSAHYWARCFREHGHEVRLIAPQCIKAYVKSPKHEARDAEAICEAMSRPTMRLVPMKQPEPQDLRALDWVRERLMKARTALVHESRGRLHDDGMVPREHSTGDTPRLLGIGTRGDSYRRQLCVHGARATRRWVDSKPADRSRWLTALIARRGNNPGAVA